MSETVKYSEYDGELPANHCCDPEVLECDHDATLVIFEEAPVDGGVVMCSDCGGSI